MQNKNLHQYLIILNIHRPVGWAQTGQWAQWLKILFLVQFSLNLVYKPIVACRVRICINICNFEYPLTHMHLYANEIFGTV